MSEPFIGIQVGAISFIDEGVDATLDSFVALANVNAICVSALSWARGNAGRATDGFPDHGVREPDHLQGGAFFRPDARYYEGTSLREFTAPDPLYAGFDTLSDVIPGARRRGMAVYPYYCETSHPTPRPLWQPGFSRVLEVDARGRVATRPCLRNPDYQAWWSGIIDNWLNEYDIDGVMWGIERQGPLSSLLDGDAPTCFCRYCLEEAGRRNIDAERAAEGYRTLEDLFITSRAGIRPLDGYFIAFQRALFNHPEILQWEQLWLDAHKSMYRRIYGQVKFFGERFQVGLGIWQMIDTFNPWLRAQHDPSEYTDCADWLKPVLYNIPAGHRFAAFVERLCQTVLRDGTPEEWTPILYRILGLNEAPYKDLPKAGFRSEYVAQQTARYVAATGGGVRLYPGLGLGTESGPRQVMPPDVEAMVEAAFHGGASGIMISRNYSEITLANLTAVGTALRKLGKVT